MFLPTGRSDRRIPIEVAVELARPDASQFEETAIAQNVSAHGMRVATEHFWRLADSVLLGSPESGVRIRARVVYCQRIENNRFTVGLKLLARWERGPSRFSSPGESLQKFICGTSANQQMPSRNHRSSRKQTL